MKAILIAVIGVLMVMSYQAMVMGQPGEGDDGGDGSLQPNRTGSFISPVGTRPGGYPSRPCFGFRCRCLRSIFVMAHTSGRRYAASDTPHYLELTVGSSVRKVKLNRPIINDMTKNKGDLFKLRLSSFRFPFRCIRRSAIENVAITAGGIDGWNIDSIATFVSSYRRAYPLTVDLNAFRTVDGNGPISTRRFDLTLISM